MPGFGLIGLAGDREHHLALLGELDRIAQQVDQDLAQAGHVADDGFGGVRIDQVGQVQPFLGGAGRQQVQRALDALAQVKGLVLQLQLVGLDLGEVEDIVDDRQQRFAAVADRLDEVALLRVQLGIAAAGWSCR